MRNLRWQFLLASLALAGCAAPPPVATAAAATNTEPPKQVCTKETTIGSQIPRTVCRTPGSGADGVQALRDEMHARPDTTAHSGL